MHISVGALLVTLVISGCASSAVKPLSALKDLTRGPAVSEKNGVLRVDTSRAAFVGDTMAVGLKGLSVSLEHETKRALALRKKVKGAEDGLSDAQAIQLYARSVQVAATRFCKERDPFITEKNAAKSAKKTRKNSAKASVSKRYRRAAESRRYRILARKNPDIACVPGSVYPDKPVMLAIASDRLPDALFFAENERKAAVELLAEPMKFYPRIKVLTDLSDMQTDTPQQTEIAATADAIAGLMRASYRAGLYRYCGGTWEDKPVKPARALRDFGADYRFLRFAYVFHADKYQKEFRGVFVSCDL